MSDFSESGWVELCCHFKYLLHLRKTIEEIAETFNVSEQTIELVVSCDFAKCDEKELKKLRTLHPNFFRH